MTTPRVAILAALFITGGLTGAGSAALITADDLDPVDLVAGETPRWEMGSDGGLAITIDVYNPYERDVGVEPLAIGGWEAVGGSSDSINVAPRRWTAVTFEVIPDCEAEVGGSLDVAVRGVARGLKLTDQVVRTLDRPRQWYCGGDGIVLEPEVEARSWDGDAYVLDVRIPGHGRAGLGALTIVEAAAGAPYMVETDALPITLPVEDSITLTTRWTFDCEIDPADLAEPMIPGGVITYDAVYLITPDKLRIHADVSAWLRIARFRACAGSE